MSTDPSLSREGALAKNTAILALGTFLPKLASLVVLPILTGCLTAEEYGSYDLVTILVSLFLPALTLQIQTASFRYLIGVRDDESQIREIISSTYAFVSVISIVGLTVYFLLMPSGTVLDRVLICLYYLMDIWYNCLLQCARGLGENGKYALSSISYSVAQLVLTVVFVWMLGWGLTGCLIMLVASTATSFSYLAYRMSLASHLSVKQVSGARIKELLAYSWPMVPNSMSMWAMRSISRVIITVFMGAAANAVFAVAYKIPHMVTLAQSTFTMAWQENASISADDKDSDEYYSSMFNEIYKFMFGITAMLLAFTPVLFAILVRGDYEESYTHIPILFIAVFFQSITAFLGGIYVARMKTLSVGITTVTCAVVSSLITWFGVPVYGLFAASYAMAISYFLLAAYRMIDVRRFALMHYQLGLQLLLLLVLVGMAFVTAQRNIVLDVANMVASIALFLFFNHRLLKALAGKLVGMVRR